MSEFKITNVTEQDLEGIVVAQRAAWRESYPSPEHGVSAEWVHERSENFSAAYIAERLESYKNDPNILYLVAKVNDGQVIGFLHADKSAEYNELNALYIDPAYIGSGVGGAFMKKFLSWVEPKKRCRLECASYNTSAIGFYKHYGFKTTDAVLPKFGDVMPVLEMVRAEWLLRI